MLGEQREEAYVSAYQEPGVVGTVGDSTYGSDAAYVHDPHDSNGTSFRFDTTNGFVRFKYSFTGTGTTFFARTSAHTGYMQVLLFEGELTFDEAVAAAGQGDQIDTYYRDTYYNDENKYAEDADGTLYNIPVYTSKELDYETYTLLVTVAPKGTIGAGPSYPSKDKDGNNRVDENGNGIFENRSEPEFYLDGIRILQPLNIHVKEYPVYDPVTGEEISPTIYDALTAKALGAYATDGESNLDVVTLRNKLITDAEEGETDWAEDHFVVLTDTNGDIVSADEYTSIGPKEEVYLAPGQKVSFTLKYWYTEGIMLYMGMKAPFGSASVKVGEHIRNLDNATDCYFDVTKYQADQGVRYEQLMNGNGYLLFNDPNSREVYKDDTGAYYYSENDQPVPAGTELTPKDDLNVPYNYITYSFECTDSIVSLTNIKVVGSHEFIILEETDGSQDTEEVPVE